MIWSFSPDLGTQLPAILAFVIERLGFAAAHFSPSVLWMPDFLRPIMAWLIPIQRDLIINLQHTIAHLTDGSAPVAATAIMSTGLIYGIVHAAGPGHGKVVVASYFASRRARISEAFIASSAIALVQALSAIFLVAVGTRVLGLGSRWLTDNVGWFDVASFGLTGIFGLVVMYRALTGKSCSHVDHADHGHHDHSACCDHEHHDHSHDHSDPDVHPVSSLREFLWGALAVGIRPCTGGILILLFTFANGLYAVGILATFAMAVGTALTVAVISLGALGVSSASERLLVRVGNTPVVERAVSLLGGGIIALIGLLMMYASLSSMT